jgi:ferredoxin--NADP+ reductase
MYLIKEARFLAPDIKLFRISAPRIARKRQAGQFVIVRVHENGERIPLTIADSDSDEGTVTIIVQNAGKTTRLLNMLEAGDAVMDIVGPLGEPSHIENFGTCVVIGGGVGTAIAYPTAVVMKQKGNHVIGIVGSRNKELFILEDEMRATTDEFFPMTDDGSFGEKGFVTQKLQSIIDSRKVDFVLAIGPIPMMRAVANVTRELGIKTMVSLNPIMVDGTGMCGGCRVQIAGQTKFACVDGPEFDAHDVDFEVLISRNSLYRDKEQKDLAEFQANPLAVLEEVRHQCRLDQAAEAIKVGND